MDTYEAIQTYKSNLIALTNNCGLTIGCAYYVAKDFLNMLEQTYLEEGRKEMSQTPQRERVEIPLQEFVEKEEVTENGEQNND